MKRILSLFATFGLILGTGISIISCNKSNSKEEKEKENFVIIQKFKKESERIYNEYINSKEIRKKLLIFLDDNKQPNNEKYEFFNKDNINNFSNGKESKLTEKEKKLLKNDMYKILGINNLKKNLEKLKEDEDFETILKGIDLISDANILYDKNFKINLVENIKNDKNNNKFFCNIIFNYKIDISYRNNKNIEDINFISNHKVVCTNNRAFIDMCNKFNENIAKDLFLNKEIRELINFCWIGKKSIKNNNEDYEGYGNFSNNIKKYINNENQKVDLEKVMKFIKEKYFESKDSNLLINIVLDENKKEEICIETQFDDNFINVFENKNSKQFVRYYNDETNNKNMFNAIFRDHKGDNIKTLKNLYFRNENIETWNKEFLNIKNKYLESKFGLRLVEIDEINKWDQYKRADSIGKIIIGGLNLEIKYKENNPFYLDLNRFDLHVIYNLMDETIENDKYIENKSKLLSEFTSKKLIKNFQDFFGIFNEDKNYPQYNSITDYFVNISNKDIIEFLEKKKRHIETYNGELINLFYCLNFYDYEKEEALIKYKEEILKNVISLISKNKIKNNYFLYYDYSSKTNDVVHNKYEDDCHKYTFAFFNNEINWRIGIKEGVLMERNKNKIDKNPDAITFKLGYLAVSIKYEKLFKLETSQNNRMFIKFIKN